LIADVAANVTEIDLISDVVSGHVSDITAIEAFANTASSLITDVSDLLSVVSGEASAVSNVASEARASVTALDNDAVGASTTSQVDTTTAISVVYQQITLADGTVFSCVKDVRHA